MTTNTTTSPAPNPNPTAEFQERVASSRKRFDAIVAWHLSLYLDKSIELPYTPDVTYINMTVGEYKYDTDPDSGLIDYSTGKYVVDEDATVQNLSKVVKFARSHTPTKPPYEIEKDYGDSNFTIKVKLPIPEPDPNYPDNPTYPGNYVTLNYYANREVACTKKVVGTKLIPAQHIPEKVEEVVEWECQKLSFLGLASDTEV